jgi:hypothetical protein
VTSNFGEYARADVGKVHAALTAVLRAVRYQFWGRGVPCPVHSAQSIVGRQLRHLHPFSSHQDILSSVTLVIVIMIVNLLLVVCSMQRAVQRAGRRSRQGKRTDGVGCQILCSFAQHQREFEGSRVREFASWYCVTPESIEDQGSSPARRRKKHLKRCWFALLC